jgi:hypothetical protein
MLLFLLYYTTQLLQDDEDRVIVVLQADFFCALERCAKSFLFHRYALRKVPRLVDIASPEGRNIIRKKLQRDHRDEGGSMPGEHQG